MVCCGALHRPLTAGLRNAPLRPLPRSCLVPDLYKGKIGVDKEEASHLLSKL